MSKIAQANIRMPFPVLERLDAEAERLGLSRSALVRRAFGLMLEVDEARALNLYVGAAKNREDLEFVLVSPA